MIASALTAIGMIVSILVKVLLPDSGGAAADAAAKGDGKPENMKEWLRNKLKALASPLGRLGIKVAEALPFITGVIISWILNRVKEVVSWVLQNLWPLVIGVRVLVYTYMVTRK